MVIKINNRPVQVREDDRKPVDKIYLTVSGLGTFGLLWIIDEFARTFTGASPFPFTHIINWVLSCF